MNPENNSCSPMDTQIFNQGLSVESTSAYIIIASLQADGLKPTLEAIRHRWNATDQALENSLNELKGMNIIERHPGPGATDPIYLVNPASLWVLAARATPNPLC